MTEQDQSEQNCPGRVLKTERERQGRACEAVAQELNIQLDKLQSLEEGQYDRLFSPVFTRGYIRSYAKLLKIDAEPLVRAYDELHREDEQPLPVGDSLNVKISGPKSAWPGRLALVLVILALWALAYWYFAEDPQTPSPGAGEQTLSSQSASSEFVAPAPTADPQTVGSALPVDAAPQIPTDAATEADTRNPAPTAEAVSAPPASSPSPAQAQAVDQVSGPDNLRVEFTEDCWVEVWDGNDERLFADLQRAGDTLRLDGVAPFEVKLGHSRGISVSVNNEPVSVPRPGSDTVVRFSTDDNR